MMKNIKGAIFDMDGTLVDSLMVWEIIWKEFGKRFQKGKKFLISKSDDKAVRTMTLKDAMEYLHSTYGLASCGKELLDAANEIILDFYKNKVVLKNGVLEFLEYCYNNDVKMCIASATDLSLVNVVIERLNIGKYFLDILSCAEIGKGKDSPDIYIKALSSLGTPIEETWVFEDSNVAISTANSIGIKTVGIFDKFNYEHERIKEVSTIYIDDGETLEKLIKM